MTCKWDLKLQELRIAIIEEDLQVLRKFIKSAKKTVEQEGPCGGYRNGFGSNACAWNVC